MYKVIRAFFDIQNENHLYKVGDTFPVSGTKVNEKRIKELLKGTNANKKIYIEEVKKDVPQSLSETKENEGNLQSSEE